jgi:hypothetical protein
MVLLGMRTKIQWSIWRLRFRSLAWGLSKNHEIMDLLKTNYHPHHGYWDYLNDLISDLRAGKCEGIQEKLRDVANNSNKFKSAVSELEIARVLIQHKKTVRLLPDAYMGKDTSGNDIPSPDILAHDGTGNPTLLNRSLMRPLEISPSITKFNRTARAKIAYRSGSASRVAAGMTATNP